MSRTLPLGQSETFSYDTSGNTHLHTDFNGNTTSYAYDDLNRLLQKTYADNSQELISYTETGQVATETNYRGTVTYTYDDNDRLVRQENPNGSFIAYSYDLAGNRTAVETAGGVTSYAFDELNRLEVVTDPDAGVSSYGYDTVGNLTSVTQANGTVTEHTYDELNRLTLLSTKDSNNNLITSFDYALDAVGNRLSVVEATGRTVNYVYDDLHRLIAEQVLDFTNGDALYEYSYDAVGNRLTKHTNGVLEESYNYDANDQLLNSTTSSFSYDNNGNTLTENTSTGLRSYSYDFDNRLIQAVTPSDVINYSYDTSGIRQSKSVNGLQTNYTVDKNRDYAQVLEERDGANGDLLIEYVHGADLLSQQISGMGSYYFHTDGLGSTRALTDNTQLLTDSYDYEAFGQELTSSFGSTPNSYRYTGEQYDGEVAKYYLRDRYYSPTIGRFGQMDRFAGFDGKPKSLNKFAYADGNPVMAVDPSGQSSEYSIAGISIAAGIGGIVGGISSYDPASPTKSIAKGFAIGAVLAVGFEVATVFTLTRVTVALSAAKLSRIVIANPNVVNKVMQTKHAWERVLPLGNDKVKNFDQVVNLLETAAIKSERNIVRLEGFPRTGAISHIRTDYVAKINGQNVRAVFETNLQTGKTYLNDAWVVTK